ncbi:4Fe-4S binding domain protein [Novipirellula galeiformis]|uniref:4Fe-4S binding domain protein n=1 Tax=Novipirellula galeiformis TaxID=2528004 RepID=A0A5C6C711_9BACT|nr:ferredoxin family protein [Novipirellula galeiformis]TWU20430.1 4Fe-4S binding domain protein [Novipirellula galeiformis]
MISATERAAYTVVVSRGQSRNPQKRAIEQQITDAATHIEGVDVLVVPHLYDLSKTSEAYQRLADAEGHLIVFSWIYSRAAHWVLDRNGIQGQWGGSEIGDAEQGAGEQDSDESTAAPDGESTESPAAVDRVTDLYPRPDRLVHCIDLKLAGDAAPFLREMKRIIEPAAPQAERPSSSTSLPIVGGKLVEVEESTSRRWYPVIDYSRCTNCMECVDFCLFGVYGIDGVENILVEQPDNCRKGCPACSRVCPENAIIFPQHKAPAIAGAEVEGDEGFKIDLSQLFGAPTGNDDPIATAARERDEQLLLAGRDTVGIDDQLLKRQQQHANKPKDSLDRLIDSLDDFDL